MVLITAPTPLEVSGSGSNDLDGIWLPKPDLKDCGQGSQAYVSVYDKGFLYEYDIGGGDVKWVFANTNSRVSIR